MDDANRCPNCGSGGFSGEQPCKGCGWLPLQRTELVFVEDSVAACPRCGSRRPVNTSCPKCGTETVLDELSEHVSNFGISNLFLLMTLVAGCVALCTAAIGPGLFVSSVCGLALVRTVLLMIERKRHRYPVRDVDILKFFGMSALGILVGGFIFLSVAGLEAVVCGIVFAAATQFVNELIVSSLLLLCVIAPALATTLSFPAHRKPCLRGAVFAAGIAVLLSPFFFLLTSLQGEFLCIASLIIFYAAYSLTFAARKGSSTKLLAFTVGFFASLCPLSLLTFTASRFLSPALIGLVFALPPTLCLIAVLSKMWKWDDAFPRALGNDRFNPNSLADSQQRQERRPSASAPRVPARAKNDGSDAVGETDLQETEAPVTGVHAKDETNTIAGAEQPEAEAEGQRGEAAPNERSREALEDRGISFVD